MHAIARCLGITNFYFRFDKSNLLQAILHTYRKRIFYVSPLLQKIGLAHRYARHGMSFFARRCHVRFVNGWMEALVLNKWQDCFSVCIISQVEYNKNTKTSRAYASIRSLFDIGTVNYLCKLFYSKKISHREIQNQFLNRREQNKINEKYIKMG